MAISAYSSSAAVAAAATFVHDIAADPRVVIAASGPTPAAPDSRAAPIALVVFQDLGVVSAAAALFQATAIGFSQKVVAASHTDYCYSLIPVLEEVQYSRSQVPTGVQPK
jgi:hypothetical protein